MMNETKGEWRTIVITRPVRTMGNGLFVTFLCENLAKGYISESKSPISSPFFFIKKKDGSLQPVQDYRRLNEITVATCGRARWERDLPVEWG